MLISYVYILLLLTNMASIINIVCIEGIETKPSADIIAPDVGVTMMHLLGVS